MRSAMRRLVFACCLLAAAASTSTAIAASTAKLSKAFAERAARGYVADHYNLDADFLLGCKPWGSSTGFDEDVLRRYARWRCEWAGTGDMGGSCDGVLSVQARSGGPRVRVVRGRRCYG